jgi:hypothetical protein
VENYRSSSQLGPSLRILTKRSPVLSVWYIDACTLVKVHMQVPLTFGRLGAYAWDECRQGESKYVGGCTSVEMHVKVSTSLVVGLAMVTCTSVFPTRRLEAPETFLA